MSDNETQTPDEDGVLPPANPPIKPPPPPPPTGG